MRNFTLLFLMVWVGVPVPSARGEDLSYYDHLGRHHYVPEEGFVPDAETAAKIAEAVWRPIYGDIIEKERPFQATLAKGIWKVWGTPAKGTSASVSEAEIRKLDGQILRISHGE